MYHLDITRTSGSVWLVQLFPVRILNKQSTFSLPCLPLFHILWSLSYWTLSYWPLIHFSAVFASDPPPWHGERLLPPLFVQSTVRNKYHRPYFTFLGDQNIYVNYIYFTWFTRCCRHPTRFWGWQWSNYPCNISGGGSGEYMCIQHSIFLTDFQCFLSPARAASSSKAK